LLAGVPPVLCGRKPLNPAFTAKVRLQDLKSVTGRIIP
jgi:hypothetical protein